MYQLIALIFIFGSLGRLFTNASNPIPQSSYSFSLRSPYQFTSYGGGDFGGLNSMRTMYAVGQDEDTGGGGSAEYTSADETAGKKKKNSPKVLLKLLRILEEGVLGPENESNEKKKKGNAKRKKQGKKGKKSKKGKAKDGKKRSNKKRSMKNRKKSQRSASKDGVIEASLRDGYPDQIMFRQTMPLRGSSMTSDQILSLLPGDNLRYSDAGGLADESVGRMSQRVGLESQVVPHERQILTGKRLALAGQRLPVAGKRKGIAGQRLSLASPGVVNQRMGMSGLLLEAEPLVQPSGRLLRQYVASPSENIVDIQRVDPTVVIPTNEVTKKQIKAVPGTKIRVLESQPVKAKVLRVLKRVVPSATVVRPVTAVRSHRIIAPGTRIVRPVKRLLRKFVPLRPGPSKRAKSKYTKSRPKLATSVYPTRGIQPNNFASSYTTGAAGSLRFDGRAPKRTLLRPVERQGINPSWGQHRYSPTSNLRSFGLGRDEPYGEVNSIMRDTSRAENPYGQMIGFEQSSFDQSIGQSMEAYDNGIINQGFLQDPTLSLSDVYNRGSQGSVRPSGVIGSQQVHGQKRQGSRPNVGLTGTQQGNLPMPAVSSQNPQGNRPYGGGMPGILQSNWQQTEVVGQGTLPQGFETMGNQQVNWPLAGTGQIPQGNRPQGTGQNFQGNRPQGTGQNSQGYRPQGAGQNPQGYRPQGIGQNPQGYRPQGTGQNPQGNRPQGTGMLGTQQSYWTEVGGLSGEQQTYLPPDNAQQSGSQQGNKPINQSGARPSGSGGRPSGMRPPVNRPVQVNKPSMLSKPRPQPYGQTIGTSNIQNGNLITPLRHMQGGSQSQSILDDGTIIQESPGSMQLISTNDQMQRSPVEPVREMVVEDEAMLVPPPRVREYVANEFGEFVPQRAESASLGTLPNTGVMVHKHAFPEIIRIMVEGLLGNGLGVPPRNIVRIIPRKVAIERSKKDKKDKSDISVFEFGNKVRKALRKLKLRRLRLKLLEKSKHNNKVRKSTTAKPIISKHIPAMTPIPDSALKKSKRSSTTTTTSKPKRAKLKPPGQSRKKTSSTPFPSDKSDNLDVSDDFDDGKKPPSIFRRKVDSGKKSEDGRKTDENSSRH